MVVVRKARDVAGVSSNVIVMRHERTAVCSPLCFRIGHDSVGPGPTTPGRATLGPSRQRQRQCQTISRSALLGPSIKERACSCDRSFSLIPPITASGHLVYVHTRLGDRMNKVLTCQSCVHVLSSGVKLDTTRLPKHLPLPNAGGYL